ncbi:21591_t:CDS:1, partial [Racocetra persica]
DTTQVLFSTRDLCQTPSLPFTNIPLTLFSPPALHSTYQTLNRLPSQPFHTNLSLFSNQTTNQPLNPIAHFASYINLFATPVQPLSLSKNYPQTQKPASIATPPPHPPVQNPSPIQSTPQAIILYSPPA